MNLVFVSEARFEKGTDGKVYAPDGGMRASFWNRYLSKFEHVTVIARVLQTDNYFSEELVAESDRVSFLELPYYIGVNGFLKNVLKIKKIISEQANDKNAYICRGCGLLAKFMVDALNIKKIPYGIEVVGDPWDVFARGAVDHPLRPFLRLYFYRLQKKIVRGSTATLYVTKTKLQQRYPIKPGTFEVSASDVVIDRKNLPALSHVIGDSSCVNLVSVGSLAQMYKSPDVVIRALSVLRSRNINCHLTWCGGGYYQQEMERFADICGVSDMISFVGSITGQEVKAKLAKSDIFILVSRTEGLPRAVVEAMSMGLACIGSKAGGIPELLDPCALVEINDHIGLSNKIEEFIMNPVIANKQAERNFIEARNYYDDVLSERRVSFLEQLIKLS